MLPVGGMGVGGYSLTTVTGPSRGQAVNCNFADNDLRSLA